ncbi:hypothetical protein AAY473_036039, partial [Plecturocebus cupreus]
MDVHHCTGLIFVFLVEMGFHHVGQAGLELLTSSDPPASASQSAGISTGISHCTILLNRILDEKIDANMNIYKRYSLASAKKDIIPMLCNQSAISSGGESSKEEEVMTCNKEGLRLLNLNMSKDFEHFGRPRQAHQLRSGLQDQSGQHGETPSLLKTQKLVGHGWSAMVPSQLTATSVSQVQGFMYKFLQGILCDAEFGASIDPIAQIDFLVSIVLIFLSVCTQDFAPINRYKKGVQFQFSQHLLSKTPKAMATKAKIYNWNPIKLKTSAKETTQQKKLVSEQVPTKLPKFKGYSDKSLDLGVRVYANAMHELIKIDNLGAVACACNPSTLGGRGGQI